MLKMPYYKNDAAGSGKGYSRHEDALAEVLKRNGFGKYIPTKKLEKKKAERWQEHPKESADMPIGTFIEQPFGSQSSPDFIIKVSKDFVIFLEAKSSTTTAPTYNSGGVKRNYLYVFCSQKTNSTTLFLGESIITLEQERLINEHIQEARLRDEELNRQLAELDLGHRGVSYYTRPMIMQKGPASYTNYFTHKGREAAENRVLEWVSLYGPITDILCALVDKVVEAGESDVKTVNNIVEKTAPKKKTRIKEIMCKCGATTHRRITSNNCPLNPKRKPLAKKIETISSQ